MTVRSCFQALPRLLLRCDVQYNIQCCDMRFFVWSYAVCSQTGWGVTLPWLTYVEEASDVRDGTDIEMQLTFASEMRIILAKYSLDGTWLGLEEMSTQVRAVHNGTRIGRSCSWASSRFFRGRRDAEVVVFRQTHYWALPSLSL